MAISRSAESNEDFLKLIKKWVGIEEATLLMIKGYEGKISNPVVDVLIDTIKTDSEKHKKILNMVIQGLEGTLVLSPDDMAQLSEFIKKHSKIEQDSVDIAEQALKKVSTPITKLLMTYLLEDEKKHDMIMDGLDELKATAMRAT